MTPSRKWKDNSQNGWKYSQAIYLIKGPVARIYGELLQLSNMKTNSQMKNWTKNLNRHFSLEDIQMANEHTQKEAHH